MTHRAVLKAAYEIFDANTQEGGTLLLSREMAAIIERETKYSRLVEIIKSLPHQQHSVWPTNRRGNPVRMLTGRALSEYHAEQEKEPCVKDCVRCRFDRVLSEIEEGSNG